MNNSVILCEGYHDRAFWAGLLTSQGWQDARFRDNPAVAGIAHDLGGKPVQGKGQYAYYSPNGSFVRVVPCHGRDKLLASTRLELRARATNPAYRLTRLVLNVDPDTEADGSSTATGLRPQDILHEVQRDIPQAILRTEGETTGEIEVDNGASIVSLVRWEASDPSLAGLPPTQTLERLVCAAIVAAYPERGGWVEAWLASRPVPPKACVKEYAWSYMAGWYAVNGCDDFYKELWRDKPVQAELETRLRQSQAWRVVEALVQ